MCNQRGRCLIRLIYATILERFYMPWTFLARPTLYLVCLFLFPDWPCCESGVDIDLQDILRRDCKRWLRSCKTLLLGHNLLLTYSRTTAIFSWHSLDTGLDNFRTIPPGLFAFLPIKDFYLLRPVFNALSWPRTFLHDPYSHSTPSKRMGQLQGTFLLVPMAWTHKTLYTNLSLVRFVRLSSVNHLFCCFGLAVFLLDSDLFGLFTYAF